ncbi:glycosyltransferase family 9 protein [Rhodococcus sp. NPDC058521]|uniref:glycosyltransferase family 9 protein n=1 Tax=Rhodococcus sp. NPDC058521 TaxID=3346536 RepID=UPI0036487503
MALTVPTTGSAAPTVLVLRALGIGDFLTAIPAIRGLRAQFPDHQLILAGPVALTPLVKLVDEIDNLIDTPSLGTLDCRGGRIAVAVNLHGCGPDSITDLTRQNPEQVFTHRHPDFPGLPGPAWVSDQHERHRWCALLEWYGIGSAPDDVGIRVPTDGERPRAVVIHPGAAAAARRWPAERYASVARALAAEGAYVVVTGNADERQLAESIAHEAGLSPDRALAGTSLSDTAALVAAAALVVSGDTGIAHLASAYDVPSVVLFGPTSPAHWGPPDRPHHITLWAGREGDPHSTVLDPGLEEISVDDVRDAIARLPASARRDLTLGGAHV